MYLSKLQNVFVQITKLICPIYNVHLKIPGICGNILTINLLVAISTLSQVFSATKIKMLIENIVNATISGIWKGRTKIWLRNDAGDDREEASKSVPWFYTLPPIGFMPLVQWNYDNLDLDSTLTLTLTCYLILKLILMIEEVCSLVLSASPNWFYAARTMELQPGQIAVRPVNQEGRTQEFLDFIFHFWQCLRALDAYGWGCHVRRNIARGPLAEAQRTQTIESITLVSHLANRERF